MINRCDRLDLARLVVDDEQRGILGRQQGISNRITYRFARHVRCSFPARRTSAPHSVTASLNYSCLPTQAECYSLLPGSGRLHRPEAAGRRKRSYVSSTTSGAPTGPRVPDYAAVPRPSLDASLNGRTARSLTMPETDAARGDTTTSQQPAQSGNRRNMRQGDK